MENVAQYIPHSLPAIWMGTFILLLGALLLMHFIHTLVWGFGFRASWLLRVCAWLIIAGILGMVILETIIYVGDLLVHG